MGQPGSFKVQQVVQSQVNSCCTVGQQVVMEGQGVVCSPAMLFVRGRVLFRGEFMMLSMRPDE